jgi:hypothetical protein
MNRIVNSAALAVSALALTAASASAAQTSITDKLSANHAAIEVTGEPAGTSAIGLAIMKSTAGEGLKYVRIPAMQKVYTPPAATPVVDVIADNSSGSAIGSWAGRLKTTPGGVAPTSLTEKLSSNHASIEVTGDPSGTASIGVALMSDTAGANLTYTRIPVTQASYTPPVATPVVDMIANDASGQPIGNWAGRVQTTPVVEPTPTPTPTPEPTPTPTPTPASMIVSLNAGGWGPGELTDLKGVVSTLRIDTASNSTAASYAGAGYKVIDDISGPYSSSGVSGVDPQAIAAEALARWKANPNIVAIEIMNEPAGNWFWGANAMSETNVIAYAHMLKVVYEAFAPYGSARPKLLASYDGGGEKEAEWGARWFKLIDPKWIDGVTVHPYGGTGNRAASGLGDRHRVEQAHAGTGLPVWATEIGWPTAVGQPATGDSLQWTEAEQSANISSFVKWARGLGYVADVTIFGAHDYGTNNFYGIETSTGAHKLSYTTLKTLSNESLSSE